MRKITLFAMFLWGIAAAVQAQSVFPARPDDANAVYLTADQFQVRGDGAADDSAAIQAAIDKIQETSGEGILFIPAGRYRITRTIYVWPGIRLIGYGATRPVFVLADKTPGYQQGVGCMFFYSGFRLNRRPGAAVPPAFAAFRPPPPPPGTVPHNPSITDANPGTFYSAMSNVDFEIGDNNAGAVAIRFHVAQHGYLSHINFQIGSGLAGVQDVGNEAEDLHFRGGRYGIITKKPSPAWPFALVDSTFEGQREAAIRTNEAAFTLVNATIRNVPTAIAIDKGYAEQLWVKNSRFENISGPAVLISNENSRMTQINLENIVCRGVPVFAQFRESGRKLAGTGDVYEVKALSHGLTLASLGATGAIKTSFDAVPLKALPPALPPVIRSLPPMSDWVNLRSQGAKGDGVTDETALIQKAIATHRVLYVPIGRYVVTDTLKLRPDSVIIGFHPDQTQFDILDNTPAFQGPGAPKALIETPRGGDNIVTGIGLYTGGINSRAVGALWMAGKNSLMNDVRFLGGHGTNGPDGKRVSPYAPNLASDPDPRRRWDSQYPSLWVTHGGGGTFVNIWTPSTFAQNGLYVSDTTTPGLVIQVSAEHHVRTEVKVDNAANWEFYALQTEGEREESKAASALEVSRSRNLTFANFHGYRVTRSYQPFPYAIRLTDSTNIRFRNVHVDGNSSASRCDESGCRQVVRANRVSYGTCIYDPATGAEVRDREFAWLDVPGTPPTAKPAGVPAILAPGARVEKLSEGFYNIAGAAVDAAGRVYFVDAYYHRIYRWSPETKKLDIIRDNPLLPVNLAFDNAGNLLVVSSGGKGMTVYAFQPDGPEDEVTVLEPQPAQERPGMTAVLPVNYWVNGDFTNTFNTDTYEYVTLDELFTKLVTSRRRYQYISPDRSVFMPADEAFVQGPPTSGYKFGDLLQASGLVKAAAGKTFYVTNEAEQRTYSGTVNPDGTLSALKTFLWQGGESLAQDRDGNVYLAAGQIFVYSPAGRLIDTIQVPERPLDIVFGGKDRRTLFILTQDTLYSVRTKTGGQ